MENNNLLKISNCELEITMRTVGDKKLTTPELIAESILILFNDIDIKNFETHGVYEKFFVYMDEFKQEIHEIYNWAGMDNIK